MKERENLHKKALKAASEYRKAEWQIIEILQVIDREKLYYHYNCKSLFRYCVNLLKLSEATSYSLINISRTSQQVPELKEKIKTGEISTSKASRICSVLKQESPDHKSRYAKPKDLTLNESQKNRKDNQEWLKKAASLTSRELEKEVIKARPKDFSLRENKRQLSEDYFGLYLKLGKEEIELLERLKEVTRKNTYTEAIKAATHFYLEKKDPIKKKIRVKKTLHTQGSHRKRKKIPEAIKIALYQKQNFQCQKCGTTKNLEIHHINPLSFGGTNELNNLDLLCSSCHRKYHFLKNKANGTLRLQTQIATVLHLGFQEALPRRRNHFP